MLAGLLKSCRRAGSVAFVEALTGASKSNTSAETARASRARPSSGSICLISASLATPRKSLYRRQTSVKSLQENSSFSTAAATKRTMVTHQETN